MTHPQRPNRPNTDGLRTSWDVLRGQVDAYSAVTKPGENLRPLLDLLIDTRTGLTILERWADDIERYTNRVEQLVREAPTVADQVNLAEAALRPEYQKVLDGAQAEQRIAEDRAHVLATELEAERARKREALAQVQRLEEENGRLREEMTCKYADACNAADADGDYAPSVTRTPEQLDIEEARRSEMIDAAHFSLDQAAAAFAKSQQTGNSKTGYWLQRAQVYAALANVHTF